MKDSFAFKNTEITGPALNFAEVTPSDVIAGDFENVSRGIYVGIGGNVALVDTQGNEVIFYNVPSGTLLPVRARRCGAATTSATALVVLW